MKESLFEILLNLFETTLLRLKEVNTPTESAHKPLIEKTFEPASQENVELNREIYDMIAKKSGDLHFLLNKQRNPTTPYHISLMIPRIS